MREQPVSPIEFAKILADDTRQKIMQLCGSRWISVGEIVEALNVTQPTVSHHLNILKDAGLAHVRREGKQIFYRLNQAKVAATCIYLAEIFAPDYRLKPERRE